MTDVTKHVHVRTHEDGVVGTFQRDSFMLRLTIGDLEVDVDVSGVLHEACAIRDVASVFIGGERTSVRVHAAGFYAGVDQDLLRGDFNMRDAVMARAVALKTKRDAKRPRAPSSTDGGAAAANASDSDIEFVKERTREDRDAEGRANAVLIE